jgi:hypothetical protein
MQLPCALRVGFPFLVTSWILIASCRSFTTLSLAPRSTAVLPSPSRCAFIFSVDMSRSRLSSSFFGDFEKFDKENEDDDEDDEDEDDEDDEDDTDDRSIADFRSKMGAMFGTEEKVEKTSDTGTISSVDELISFARSKGDTPKEAAAWAKHSSDILAGVVLLANPARFCSDFGPKPAKPSAALLAKFGLTVPPPADLGPDRRADLLPVLALVEQQDKRGSRAVLLNRRTGYLLGDLERPPPGAGEDAASVAPLLEKFCIQPLWFGGIDNISSGLDMLHLCPAVAGAKKLTEDGLFWGGDPAQAQDAMEDPSLEKPMSGFDFKFFVQSTLWSPNELAKEVKDDTWFVARVSKEILFKSRDRMGTRRAKPLWTEIMELMGGEYKDIRDQFYGDK